jgi:hypothetical protein
MSFFNYYHASKLLACIGMVHILLILFYPYHALSDEAIKIFVANTLLFKVLSFPFKKKAIFSTGTHLLIYV